MRGWLFLALLVTGGYVAGAKWPGLAQRIGVA
jgi:hypothetical protein